jgi:hypothetical protein
MALIGSPRRTAITPTAAAPSSATAHQASIESVFFIFINFMSVEHCVESGAQAQSRNTAAALATCSTQLSNRFPQKS